MPNCIKCGKELEVWKEDVTKLHQKFIYDMLQPDDTIITEIVYKDVTRNKARGYKCTHCNKQWIFKEHIDNQSHTILKLKELEERLIKLEEME